MIIVNIEMKEKPDKCEDCLLRVAAESDYYCAADQERRSMSYNSWRPYWCPIEEIDESDHWDSCARTAAGTGRVGAD